MSDNDDTSLFSTDAGGTNLDSGIDAINDDDAKCESWNPHYSLYVYNFCFCFGDRLFEFAVFCSLAYIFPFTLVIAAAYGLITSATSFLLLGTMTRVVGKLGGHKLQIASTVIHKVVMAICFISIYVLKTIFLANRSMEILDDIPWSDAGFDFLVVFLVFFSSLFQLASLVCALNMSKSWVDVIGNSRPFSGPVPPTPEELNVVLQRIGFLCKLVSPLCFACLIIATSLETALLISVGLAVTLGIFEVLLQWVLCSNFPELESSNPKKSPAAKPTTEHATESSWKTYKTQPTFLSSCAHVLTYMSSLTPGIIIVTYLIWRKLSVIEVAVFYGGGSIIGYIAVLITPVISESIGPAKTALISIWTLFILLAFGVILPLFILPHISVWYTLSALLLARIPSWSFDITQAQLVQDNILVQQSLAVVSSVNYKLTNLMIFFNFSWAIVAVNSENFRWLAIVGVLATLGGACLLSYWYHVQPRANVDHDQELARVH